MRLQAKIGKVTPKAGIVLLERSRSLSTKTVMDGVADWTSSVRAGHLDGSPYVGFAAVAWTANGKTCVHYRNEGGVPGFLAPTLVAEALRDYIIGD